MSLKTFVTLALATGFAAAKPISAPQSKRNNNIFGQGFNGAVANGFNGQGFNFADGFANFNQQQQVIQIQEQNLQIVDNGFRQQVVQQVNQVLVVDQVNNGFNNDLNNLFRKSNFQNQFRDVATVMMVVQQINVAVDDGRGGQFRQEVFAQNVVVANRGARQTQQVMIFDSRTLIAQDVLRNNAFGNLRQFGGVAGATGDLNKLLPTKTNGLQLFGAKPTWTAIAEDPAAALGGIWENALKDLQNNQNDEADNKLNDQLAAQEKQKLDELKQQDEQKKQEEQKQQDEQKKQEAQKQQDEQKKQEEQKQQEEQKKQEEQQKQDEQKKQEEQQKQDEQKKQEEQKQEGEQQKQEEQKKQEEQQKQEQMAQAGEQAAENKTEKA